MSHVLFLSNMSNDIIKMDDLKGKNVMTDILS